MEHILGLQPKYFELVKLGEKIYEVRLNDEKRQKINIGDTIIFCKEPKRDEKISAKVEDKLIFKSFEEMVNSLNKKDIGFSSSTKEEILTIYREFYNEECEQKYGIIAIKVKVF